MNLANSILDEIMHVHELADTPIWLGFMIGKSSKTCSYFVFCNFGINLAMWVLKVIHVWNNKCTRLENEWLIDCWEDKALLSLEGEALEPVHLSEFCYDLCLLLLSVLNYFFSKQFSVHTHVVLTHQDTISGIITGFAVALKLLKILLVYF